MIETKLKFPSLLIIILLLSGSIGCKQEQAGEEKTDTAKDTSVAGDAFRRLNDRIAAEPGNAALYFERAQEFFSRGVIRQAFDDVSKAITLDSTKAEYYFLKAEISFKAVQISEAIAAFEKVTELKPADKEAHLKLAELFLYIKGYPKAVHYANEVLRIDKNETKAYFIKGFVYKETGDTNMAVSSFRTAVELNPEHYDAYIQLGNIFSAKNDPLALQYYNNALRVQPKSTEALYNRGLFFQNRNDTANAIADYEKILQIDPGYADAHYNLGFIAVAYRNDFKAAINYFSNAIRIDDHYYEAYYNRGFCHEQLGNFAEAEKDYRASIGVVPTYKPALEGLERLRTR